MKYNLKYPNCNYGDEPEQSLCKGNRYGRCWNCNEYTIWYDIDFLACICSEECRKIKMDECIKAYNKFY